MKWYFKPKKNSLFYNLYLLVTFSLIIMMSCDGKTFPIKKHLDSIEPDFPSAQSADSAMDDFDLAEYDDIVKNNRFDDRARHGNEKNLEMPMSGRGDNVIRHTGYALSFNGETNCPNWVAWELTRQEAYGRGKRNPDFYADPKVEGRHQVTTDDYRGSGYSRGHMCPAGDMKWSGAAQHDCFYMTNMCPQNRELNGNSWENLESACRRWANQEGSVYIVCGPVFNDARKVRTIGREHKVRVPDGFFKVVMSMKPNKEKAIGFYYANNSRIQTMEEAAMSVDEVEKLTGYDFYYLVNDKIENRIEQKCDLREWQ